MAKRNLEPDYIKWVLTLNATQAQEEIHKLEKSNKDLNKSSTELRKRIADLEAQGKKGSTEWKNLRKSLNEYSQEISQNKKKIADLTKQIDLGSMSMNQLKKYLKELQREFNNTSKATDPKRYKELQREINNVREAMRKATSDTSGLRGAFAKLGKTKEMLVGFFFGIGDSVFQLVTGSFRNAFNLVIDFEKENSKLAGILSATKDEMKEMEGAARQLGSTTSYSAAQVTSLQIELAKLGFTRQEILDMESGVLKFAKAVGTDLASAAAFSGAALRMFGKDASEADGVLATFAVATTKTALDFSKLEASLATVGPVANAFGFSIEDTTALLGKLADAGFDASSAATATRNIILSLADSNGDLAKALGGPVKNADDLAKGLKKLNDEGIDLAKALELTDKRSVAAFSTFLSQADNLSALKSEISGVTDQFNAMSETMGDNVAGAMAGLQSASEELVLKIASGTNGPIKDLINALTKIVQWTGTAIQWISRYSSYVKVAAITIGSYVGAIKLATIAKNLWNAAMSGSRNIIIGFIALIKNLITHLKSQEIASIGARRAIVAFKHTLNSIPWVAIISAVASLITYFISLRKETDKATESTNHYNEASKEAARLYGEQKGKIDSLLRVAQNEELSLRARKKAVDELNKIIPGYNAQIDQTTKKYTAANNVLEAYLKNLEAEIRFKTYEDKYKQLVADQMAAVDALDQARIELQENRYKKGLFGMKMYNMEAKQAVRDAEDELITANKNLDAFKKRMDQAEKRGIIKTPEASPEVNEDSGGAGSGNGSKNNKPTPDTNPAGLIDKATAQADDAHQKRLLAINMEKETLPENEYIIKKNLEMIQYCGELSEALDALEKKTDATHTQTLDKIKDRQNKINLDIEKANQAINAAMVKEDAANHQKKMDFLKMAAEEENRVYEEKLQNLEITQGEYEILQLKSQRESHSEQLAELERYLKEVQQCTYISETERKKIVEKTESELRKMRSQVLTDTGKWQEKLRSLLKDPTTAEGMTEAYELQRMNIKATYDMMITECAGAAEMIEELEAEKNRRLLVLDLERQEQLYQLQEATGLSWQDEYDRELLKLQTLHAKGLISEKKYQKARLQAGKENTKKYYDYYSQLAGSTVSAIQNAEIAQVESKYEVLIQQAKNNGEDTAALEEEKENKKLEIQKRYADVDFAVKIAQIIADTSVSIMKAFSQLGPIGGAVAAALLTATGIAQVVTAKAQRDQVKNMEPGRTATSGTSITTTPTLTRQLTGYSEGGYTGPGDRYEIAGVVHKGEYVIPKPIMTDPRVIDAVGMIEAIRVHKRQTPATIRATGTDGIGYPGAGYADGGYTGGITVDAAGFREAVSEFRRIAGNLRAYVLWKDIEKAKIETDRSRSPFTK